jgi:hypothetical protein
MLNLTASPKRAVQIDRLTEALTALSIGQVISYETLSKIAGEPMGSTSYAVRRALSRAEKETGALFGNVRNEGFQRLRAEHAPGVGGKANDHIRRHARKTERRLGSWRPPNDATQSQIAEVAAYRAHMGMVASIATKNIIKSLTKSIEEAAPISPETMAQRLAETMGKSRDKAR